MAGQAGKRDLAANAKIHTSVHIGEPSDIPGFGIAVDIEVEGVPDEQLIQDAHAVRISRHMPREVYYLNYLMCNRHALIPGLLAVAHKSPSRASENLRGCMTKYTYNRCQVSCIRSHVHKLAPTRKWKSCIVVFTLPSLSKEIIGLDYY
jgi:hypothetical protein